MSSAYPHLQFCQSNIDSYSAVFDTILNWYINGRNKKAAISMVRMLNIFAHEKTRSWLIRCMQESNTPSMFNTRTSIYAKHYFSTIERILKNTSGPDQEKLAIDKISDNESILLEKCFYSYIICKWYDERFKVKPIYAKNERSV